jgi:hypothetical protein
MFSKCSNPDCRAPFDYRQGRLIRFNKPSFDFQFPIDHGCVEHFWLCENCSKFYAFDFERGTGMKIKIRVIGRPERQAPGLVLPAGNWESGRTKSAISAVGSQARA